MNTTPTLTEFWFSVSQGHATDRRVGDNPGISHCYKFVAVNSQLCVVPVDVVSRRLRPGTNPWTGNDRFFIRLAQKMIKHLLLPGGTLIISPPIYSILHFFRGTTSAM